MHLKITWSRNKLKYNKNYSKGLKKYWSYNCNKKCFNDLRNSLLLLQKRIQINLSNFFKDIKRTTNSKDISAILQKTIIVFLLCWRKKIFFPILLAIN